MMQLAYQWGSGRGSGVFCFGGINFKVREVMKGAYIVMEQWRGGVSDLDEGHCMRMLVLSILLSGTMVVIKMCWERHAGQAERTI